MHYPAPYSNNGKNLFRSSGNMERSLLGDLFGGPPQIRTDILDKGDRFVLLAELPGFEKQDIEIDVQNDYLTISAKHADKFEPGSGGYIQRERRFGSFYRRFDVSGINAGKIAAQYKDGVLELTLPKNEAKPPVPGRHIDIG